MQKLAVEVKSNQELMQTKYISVKQEAEKQ
jgi:hypothetical protein